MVFSRAHKGPARKYQTLWVGVSFIIVSVDELLLGRDYDADMHIYHVLQHFLT